MDTVEEEDEEGLEEDSSMNDFIDDDEERSSVSATDSSSAGASMRCFLFPHTQGNGIVWLVAILTQQQARHPSHQVPSHDIKVEPAGW